MTFEPPLRRLNGANQARLRPLPSGTMPQPLRQSDRREPEMIEPPPRWLSGKSQARLRPSSSETVPQLRQHIDRHAPEQTPEPPPRGLKDNHDGAGAPLLAVAGQAAVLAGLHLGGREHAERAAHGIGSAMEEQP